MSVELPLSVIIPIYNGAKTIVRCLDSLVTIPDATTALEIIVINDGSQDETLEVLADYQAQHPEQTIRVITQTNQGQSVARNKGLEVAQGAYVWFVDADDWVDSTAAAYLLSLIAVESYDMLCFGVRNVADEEEEVPSEWLDSSAHDFDQLQCTDGRALLTAHNLSGGIWAFLWRRSILEEHQARFMEGLLHEDALFYWHYTAFAERVLLVPIVAYYYYQRAESTIHNPNTLHLRGISRLEGSFRLLECANEVKDLDSIYLTLASSFYRAGLRMVARYGKVSELKAYTQRMEQSGDYKLLMRYASRKGAPLIRIAHRVPWLFNLIAHILPPVS
ncbi:glycosyltransferase [uncultured Porphyromonas sp.]|uniref:glycosyltransferase family 2 protein n=1 Tax=uncultured Porphyromonas sp. TaxID=159274 RepID=UPI0026159747|nr:glycosyltransferase [uncultured Porphyromonas sp.]